MIVFSRPPGWRRRAGDPGSAGGFAEASVRTSTLRSGSAAAAEDGSSRLSDGVARGSRCPALASAKPPAERYDGALKMLAAAYYQRPQEFSDQLTALFGSDSEIAERLLAAGRCLLAFEQYSQSYTLPCSVRALAEDDPAYQATYWHNALFNPALPGGVRVLGFQPDWARAEAEPPAP